MDDRTRIASEQFAALIIADAIHSINEPGPFDHKDAIRKAFIYADQLLGGSQEMEDVQWHSDLFSESGDTCWVGVADQRGQVCCVRALKRDGSRWLNYTTGEFEEFSRDFARGSWAYPLQVYWLPIDSFPRHKDAQVSFTKFIATSQ